MIFKAVGLKPRGRLSAISTRLAWRLLQRRRRQFEARIGAMPPARRAGCAAVATDS